MFQIRFLILKIIDCQRQRYRHCGSDIIQTMASVIIVRLAIILKFKLMSPKKVRNVWQLIKMLHATSFLFTIKAHLNAQNTGLLAVV